MAEVTEIGPDVEWVAESVFQNGIWPTIDVENDIHVED
jgi:hypothetical protein